jgi:hypothetical protein
MKLSRRNLFGLTLTALVPQPRVPFRTIQRGKSANFAFSYETSLGRALDRNHLVAVQTAYQHLQHRFDVPS